MRVLHIDAYYLPSLGYGADLARAQAEMGHEVLFAASNRVPAEKGPSITLSPDGEQAFKVALLWTVFIRQRPLLFPGIVRVLFHFKPEAVHCHPVFDLTALVVALCKPLLRYRLVYCSHADLSGDANRSWWRRLAYRVFRYTAGPIIRAAADHVIAVGENEKTRLVRDLGMRPERVGIIRLGAPVARLAPAAEVRAQERTRLGIGEQEVVLIHAGTLVPRKGLHLLIKATAQIRGRSPGIHLVVVGGGDLSYIGSLKESVRQHGLADQTYLPGSFAGKEELFRLYAASDIGVWPGQISIATIEAMGAGLPLILRGGDPYTAFLTSNQNGLTFPPGDVSVLADCLADLASNEERRMEMGRASRRMAVAEFDWPAIAQKCLRLYQEGRPRPRVRGQPGCSEGLKGAPLTGGYVDADRTLPPPFIHPDARVESAHVGRGTRVWAFAHIMAGARVGMECNVGEGCFIEDGAVLGDHVTLKNGVAVWDGVTIEDYAFIGPSVAFTNDPFPRSWIVPPQWAKTRVERGASIGANASILCGISIGRYSMVGAGAVLTRGTSPFELVAGNPARHRGWVCICGRKLAEGATACACGAQVTWQADGAPAVQGAEPPAPRGGGL